MKIFTFTDIHGNQKALDHIEKTIKKEKPDLLIDCGDITIFETNLDGLLGWLADFNIPTLILHGNHESKMRFTEACKRHKNLIFMHDRTYRNGHHLFFGYGGGGFALNNKSFEKSAQKHMKERKSNDILTLLTHGPPYNTKLDELWGEPAGCKSIRKFIETQKPVIALSGHLHENNNTEDRIKKTRVINPGPYGKILVI